MTTQLRLTRRLLTTVALGSLGDWITFSALVLVVHRLAGGGPLSAFAVALVAAARLVPGVLLGPLAAPYAGVLGIRRTI
ncbi:MAG: dTMP kinase, partial [Actinomycetota bacterium]